MSDWLILRCSSGNTLKLAASLYEAGYEAWTPTETIQTRGPNRSRRKEAQPAARGYVFAASRHLTELLQETRHETSNHPTFWFLRQMGKIRFLADKQLDPLRQAVRAGLPADQITTFMDNALVKYPACGFEGLTGIVRRTLKKGRATEVEFAGRIAEVPTAKLLAA